MQHFRLAAAAAALLAACPVGAVRAQTFVNVQAEARTFHLGAIEISAIRDNALVYRTWVFTRDTDPTEVAKVLTAHGVATNGIPLDVDALLGARARACGPARHRAWSALSRRADRQPGQGGGEP